MNIFLSFDAKSEFAGQHYEEIYESLSARNDAYRIFTLQEELQYFQDSIEIVQEGLIRKCEVYIAVLESLSVSMVFEIGMAYALGKKIIIVNLLKNEVPAFLKNLPMINVQYPDDIVSLVQVLYQGIISLTDKDSNQLSKERIALYEKAFQMRYSEIEKLPPQDFEKAMFSLLDRLGMKPAAVQNQFEHGFDFRIKNFRGLGDTLVELKQYNYNTKIGITQIEQFYGVIMANQAEAGLFITSSDFTSSAINFAERLKHPVVLRTLSEFLEEFQDRL